MSFFFFFAKRKASLHASSACDEASGIKSVGAFNKKNITFYELPVYGYCTFAIWSFHNLILKNFNY